MHFALELADVQDAADTISRLMQYAAILLELGGAVLVAALFLLIRRYSLQRKYFATWTSAWLAMVVAIAAVAVRYRYLGQVVPRELPEGSWPVRGLYLLYQGGKILFWVLVCRGALEYVRLDGPRRRWWVPLAVAYAAASAALSRDLNVVLVWQAPVAVASCIVGALALFELPPPRRSVGSLATGTVLVLACLLWAVYFVVFGGATQILPPAAPWFATLVGSYNSYADVLLIVMLGYGMIVLFMEDARLRISESEARLAALVASAAEAIVTTDGDFRLLDANHAAERLFGVRRDAAVGHHLDEFVTGEHRSRLRASLESFLASADATIALEGEDELRIVSRDGARFTVEASASKLLANTTTSLALVMRDVTERRATEEKNLQERKMDAVRQLAGGMAHDFNNLLTAIVGRSQIISDALPADSPVRESVAEVSRAATSAARLARGLLALSRREPLHPERVSLNAQVRSLEAKVRAVAGPLVAAEFRYADDAGDVHADADRLHDAVLAVVHNAREAVGRAGGRITVETSRVTWQRELGRNLETACVSVRYSGRGLSADARAHLFEPFFSTKGDGRGLGLATAYAFLQQSGGWMDVQSSGSGGTTVRLALPVVPAAGVPAGHRPEPVASPAAHAAEPRQRTPRTVLVAEDEETVRRFVRIVLEREGFRVLEAENGVEAVSVFEAAGSKVDLLLTDVVMPQMGGSELAARLLAASPGLRVIFMSGYVNDGALLQGLNEQQAPFLQKPFDVQELARVVNAAAAR